MSVPKSQAAFWLLIGCLLLVLQNGADCEKQEVSARQAFRLPRFFDFDKFMLAFDRHYASTVEMLARKKLFLANVFEAFLSMVSYKHRQLDYYYGISHLSDRTQEELNQMLMRLPSTKAGLPVKDAAASEEEIGKELDSMRKQSDEPGFKEAAEELDTLIRSKREASPRSMDISSQLESSRKPRGKPIAAIPSNNPLYEPIEADSFAAESNDLGDDHLGAEQANTINSFPGASYLRSLTQSFRSLFSTEPEVSRGLKREAAKRRVKKEPELPDEVWIDHRSGGCLGEPKDQGRCGSCYIFSTLALYEWRYCKSSNRSVSFSEQYVLDCGAKFSGMRGCFTGQETDVAQFIESYGLELESNYPYKTELGVCPYDKSTSPKSMGYLRVNKLLGLRVVSQRNREKILEKTPIVYGIYTPKEFLKYKGGVMSGKNINSDGLHSVLLVGHGREDDNEYWLFKNSYGTDWGENGYFKINKKAEFWYDEDLVGWHCGTDMSLDFAGQNRGYTKPMEMTQDLADQMPDLEKLKLDDEMIVHS